MQGRVLNAESPEFIAVAVDQLSEQYIESKPVKFFGTLRSLCVHVGELRTVCRISQILELQIEVSSDRFNVGRGQATLKRFDVNRCPIGETVLSARYIRDRVVEWRGSAVYQFNLNNRR